MKGKRRFRIIDIQSIPGRTDMIAVIEPVGGCKLASGSLFSPEILGEWRFTSIGQFEPIDPTREPATMLVGIEGPNCLKNGMELIEK